MNREHLGYFAAGLVLMILVWTLFHLLFPQWSGPFTEDMALAYLLGWSGRATVPEKKKRDVSDDGH